MQHALVRRRKLCFDKETRGKETIENTTFDGSKKEKTNYSYSNISSPWMTIGL